MDFDLYGPPHTVTLIHSSEGGVLYVEMKLAHTTPLMKGMSLLISVPHLALLELISGVIHISSYHTTNEGDVPTD